MESLIYTRWSSPLGELLIVAGETGLLSVSFDAGPEQLVRSYPAAVLIPLEEAGDFSMGEESAAAAAIARQTVTSLQRYFAGDGSALDELQVAPRGTDFQRDVWQAMRNIRCGQSISYAELAGKVGRPKAARAVGAACGQNPIVLVIPCHRVLGSNRKLTGFSAGIERKAALLEHEGTAAR